MNATASPQLLDALAFTPSRNGKLALIVEYFRSHARSRPRLGAGRADRRPALPRLPLRRSARDVLDDAASIPSSSPVL